jgi:hypothetical protein
MIPNAWLAMLLVVVAMRPVDAVEVDRGGALFLVPLAIGFWLISCWRTSATVRAGSMLKWDLLKWDLATWGLVAWVIVSAGWNYGQGNFRQSWNEIWWWITAGCVFTGGLRIFTSNSDRTLAPTNAWLVLIVALGVGQSFFAAHQQWISLPADRALYEADPERFMQQLGQVADLGAPERAILEGRLYEGGPTGTFALANSLAGHLVVAIVLAVGLLWRSFRQPSGVVGFGAQVFGAQGFSALWSQRVTAGIAAGMCLSALLWTSSHSANIALACGLTVMVSEVLFGSSITARTRWYGILAGTAVSLVGMIALTWMPGWWSLVPRSLQFRFQYWQATLSMVREHWFLGIGPGNFQDRYLKYRLDQASEGIADPHNWLMEMLSIAGAPGLLMLLIVVGLCARTYSQRNTTVPIAEVTLGKQKSAPTTPLDSERWWAGKWMVGAGAWLGWFGVWIAWLSVQRMPDFDATVLATLGSTVVWFGLRQSGFCQSGIGGTRAESSDWGATSSPMLFGATVALGVHLLVSGGLTVPGLALPAMVLMALTVRETCRTQGLVMQGAVAGRVGRGKSISLCVAAASVMLAAWWWSAWVPVRDVATAISRGDAAASAGRLGLAIDEYRLGADADAWEPTPWMRIADAQLWELLGQGMNAELDEPRRQVWLDTMSQAIRRNPQAPMLAVWRAEQQLTYYQRFGDKRELAGAQAELERVLSLSPGDIRAVAQLAAVLQSLGEVEQAEQLWQRADSLVRQGEHVERRLENVRVIQVAVLGMEVARAGVVRKTAAETRQAGLLR